jgi:outer membrane protein assembly factor BamB
MGSHNSKNLFVADNEGIAIHRNEKPMNYTARWIQKENPMKSIMTSLLTGSLFLSAAMAGETGPAAIAPVGGNGQAPYSWRGINGSGVFPAEGIVTEFWDIAPDVVTSVKDSKGGERTLTLPGAPGSRKNIVWRTTLPHLGQNTPVAVKDPSSPDGSAAAGRVFVLCEEGWKSDAPLLVCCDVKDGKILWQEPVDHLDAWPADKAKVAKETRAKHLRYWREYMTWWNKLYWDNEKNTWKEGVAHSKGKPPEVIPPEQTALAAEAAKAGFKLPPTHGVGVSGGWRGRYYWGVGTEEMKQTYEACAKNRYHWYPGWTSEGPFFGSCMGSVVSDGQRVYAVTALDGAACFDLDGKRLWVTDLEGKQILNFPASASRIHNSMASPVLAGGKLIYYHYGAVEFIALDAQTGQLAWRTPGPIKAGKPRFHQVAGTPIGYEGGHMTPGGTPVVMVLGATPVVVSGHGMVCRIADGKFLGQVGFPAELAKTSKSNDADTAVNAPEEGLAYASAYPSWVAQGDTVYAVALNRLIAVRLDLKGDTITQEVAWNVDAVHGEGPNPVILGRTVYLRHGGMGVKAFDAATGKTLASGPHVAGYATNLAFTRDLAVWKGGQFDQGMNSSDKDKGVVTYTVVGVPDLKPKGKGHLWSEKPTGEIAERHIAALGTPRLTLSNSGLSCWGNRIFIRDNDYLWCIGDPKKPWLPSEAGLVRQNRIP